MSNMIIAGSDCENCKHFQDEVDINNKIKCKAKGKHYYYGQCIPCNYKEEARKEK